MAEQTMNPAVREAIEAELAERYKTDEGTPLAAYIREYVKLQRLTEEGLLELWGATPLPEPVCERCEKEPATLVADYAPYSNQVERICDACGERDFERATRANCGP